MEMGYAVEMSDTYEADDLAGSAAAKYEKEQPTYIITKDHDYLQLVSDTLAAIPGNETDCRDEEQLRQWQVDIMEENARRTGFLFGISG